MLTIGQRLKAEREARYLTIEKASDETRIRMVFLRALEADDYSVLPSAAQGRGFLRNYAKYLDINIDEVIAEMQRNAPPAEEVSGPLPQVNFLETEIPSLTESQDETNSLSSWINRIRSSAEAWFASPKQTDATLEEKPIESILQQEPTPNKIEAEPIIEKAKPSGRKKKKITEDEALIIETMPLKEKIEGEKVEAQEMPLEVEQAEVETEAKTSLLEKLLALIPSRATKVEADASKVEETAVEEKVVKPVVPAGIIFAEIGKQLRQRREMISLTVEEVERHIKLRSIFVRALEEGAFDKLPSTVQTRGMLANYSTFLDLDTDKILLRYADALQARRREKYSETPREKIQTEVKASIPLLRSFIAGDLVFGIGMIVVLLALGAWGITRVVASQAAANAEPTTAPIVNVLANSAQATPSPSSFLPVTDPGLATNVSGQTTIETPTLGLNANVAITIYAVERSYVRIAVDDKVVFEGRIAPLETQQYQAEQKIEILSGNAAALRITYNGRDLGLMGNVGEVVNRVYTISGIVAPTSTPPPTATNTPLVTNTPTSTATVTSTATLTKGTPTP